MNFKKISTFAIFFIFYASHAVDANTYHLVCNTCDENYEFYREAAQKAESQLTITGFSGTFYVINYQRNIVKGWYLELDQKFDHRGELIPDYERVNVVNVPEELVNLVERVNKLDIVQFSRKRVEIPSNSGFSSAWEMAQHPAARLQFTDWVKAEYPIDYWVNSAGSTLLGIVPLFDALKGTKFEFGFEDGSSLIFQFSTFDDRKFDLTYVLNSAKDRNGNIIRDAGQSFSGTYTFGSSTEAANFVDDAATYGITLRIISFQPGARTGYVTIIEHVPYSVE